jgi:uncharacterized membrane protein
MYLALKAIHVLAVAVFLGNIMTARFWKAHSDRTRDPRIMAATLDGIIRSDMRFTVPGLLVILITGFGAAGVARLSIMRTPWILWSIILFTLSLVVALTQVVPLQRRMHDLARVAETASFDWAAYQRLSRRWSFWGAVAILLPLGAVALMVVKPM